jgi:uncharacterized glyoxalase superfamily protein PhnB
MSQPQFLKTRIILPVAEIYDTLEWYERALGFQTRYIHGNGRRGETRDFANYAIMARDLIEVHFIMDEGGPVWTRAGTGHLGITVSDVDQAYAELKAREVAIARELQHENWPARGFEVRDPNGNVVHIEQPDR